MCIRDRICSVYHHNMVKSYSIWSFWSFFFLNLRPWMNRNHCIFSSSFCVKFSVNLRSNIWLAFGFFHWKYPKKIELPNECWCFHFFHSYFIFNIRIDANYLFLFFLQIFDWVILSYCWKEIKGKKSYLKERNFDENLIWFINLLN